MTSVDSAQLPLGVVDFADIDEVAVPRELPFGPSESHVLIVLATTLGLSNLPNVRGELLYQRQLPDGTWTPFFTLSARDFDFDTNIPSRPLRFSRVSAARVNDELHVCAVTTKPPDLNVNDAGILAHAARRYDATLPGLTEFHRWTNWVRIAPLAGIPGVTVDVGCAGVRNPATDQEELHVCAVTDDGRLWHSIRTSPTSWSPAGDPAGQAGGGGPFNRVDCAADGNLLHVVAVGRDGRALYTIRNAAGTWRTFEDVQNAASAPFTQLGSVNDVGIGLYNDGLPAGQWQLVIVALSPTDPIFYTIRSSQAVTWQQQVAPVGPRQWKPWTNLEAETANTAGGAFIAATVAWRPRVSFV